MASKERADIEIAEAGPKASINQGRLGIHNQKKRGSKSKGNVWTGER